MSNEIFGNKVSRFSAWKAGLAYKMCKKIFGEQKEGLDLVAVAKGGVYKDFKALTLVRRDDLEAQKDDDGTPLKVYEVNPKNALVIGTIRMGFGHWRIAIALYDQSIVPGASMPTSRHATEWPREQKRSVVM